MTTVLRTCLILILTTQVLRALVENHETDTIILKNGHSLSGTILSRHDVTEGEVRIRTEAGELRLPRSLVAAMKIGYTSRRRQLGEDSYADHKALALWCLNEGMKDEAFALLQKAITLGEPDAQVTGLLGLLTDELLRSPEQALPYYQRYRDEFDGEDEKILDRLAELERAEAEYQAALSQAMAKAAKHQPDEGMEVDAWVSESPKFFNPLGHDVVEVTTEGNLIANRVLQVRLKPGDNHKSAIRRRINLDARTNSKLVIHALNAGERRLPISIAVKTGERWVYYESRPQSVPANGQWVALTFDLQNQTFKSAASDWVHKVPIGTPEDVREIQIQFHNNRRDGVVNLDGIGFLDAGPPGEEPESADGE